MPSVRDVLRRKGGGVVSVSPTTSVLEAAQLMNARTTGSVVVLEDRRLRGIFTERDVLRRIVAEQRDPAATHVGQVMTSELVTCSPDDSIETCTAVMTRRRIRRLPVIDERGQIAGVITSGDLLAWQVADQADVIEHLNTYIHEYH